MSCTRHHSNVWLLMLLRLPISLSHPQDYFNLKDDDDLAKEDEGTAAKGKRDKVSTGVGRST